MTLIDHIPQDPQDGVWDVVVIGTGAGGATAGFNLARSGKSVLFLERGGSRPLSGSGAKQPSDLVRSRGEVHSDCHPYNGPTTSSENRITPELIVGCAVGGSTSLFAMVMDRFRPVDFNPNTVAQPHSLSNEWPIQYDELVPYYQEAETLYRVRGTNDPLTSTQSTLLDPLPPSDTESIVHDTLTQNGLHPYRLHYAREHASGCTGCVGTQCLRGCRNDAGRICVIPALKCHRAHILPNCLVTRLETTGRAVREAICIWRGHRIAIRAKVFVLALGALFTPCLLLRSANDSFPNGLGNSSGLVGRNLMLHVSDFLLVRFKGLSGWLNTSLQNGLSLNDFYVHEGSKLGNIHAHAMDFNELTNQSPSLNNFTATALFNTIVEDFPHVENRVFPNNGDDKDVHWEYTYPHELSSRSRKLVEAFADSIKPACNVSVMTPSGMLNGSHACGTCCFGNDPRYSVLDRDNRIHDLDNAYVLDASFFPTSGGINPSLTIAANSLRVSALIARR